jgi:hypothetical protein
MAVRETVISEEPRQSRAAKVETARILIPADAKGEIHLMLDLDLVELRDPARSLWCHVYEFVKDEWRHVAGMEWRGGDYEADLEFGLNPRLFFDVARIAGKEVRIEVLDPKGQQVGYKLMLVA